MMLLPAIAIGFISWFVALAAGMSIEEHHKAHLATKRQRFAAMFLSFLSLVLAVVSCVLFYLAGAA